MKLLMRSWTAAGIAALALTAVPEIYAVMQPSGVANAEVCAHGYDSITGCNDAYMPRPGYPTPVTEDHVIGMLLFGAPVF